MYKAVILLSILFFGNLSCTRFLKSPDMCKDNKRNNNRFASDPKFDLDVQLVENTIEKK